MGAAAGRTVMRKRIKASLAVLATCVLVVAYRIVLDTIAEGYAQGNSQGYEAVAKDMRKSLLEPHIAAAVAAPVDNGHPVTRTLHVFLHIPTTGGTSVRKLLLLQGIPVMEYGKVHAPTQSDLQKLSKLCALPDQHVVLEGHLSASDLHSLPNRAHCGGRTVRVMLLLREPLSRVVSWMKHQSTGEDYDTFVHGQLTKSVSQNILNRMVYQLGDTAELHMHNKNETHVMEAARALIKSASVILFTPTIDECWQHLLDCIHSQAKAAPHKVMHSNNHAKEKTQAARTLSAAQLGHLHARVHLDEALWEWVLEWARAKTGNPAFNGKRGCLELCNGN